MPANIQELGKYLAEQLIEYDSSTFYNPPEEDLWGVGSTVVPSVGDLPRGLQSITYFRRDVIGRASVSYQAFDIPLVSSATSKRTASAVSVVASTEWSYEDVQMHQFAQSRGLMPGDNLIQSNVADLSLAIYRRIHELTMVGFPEINFYGLFNNPQITLVDNVAGAVLLVWTPSQLYDWFQGIVSNFKKISKIPYERIIAYVSDDVMKLLSRRFTDATGDSPIQAMRSSDRGVFVGDIRTLAELDTAELFRLGVTNNNNHGLLLLGDFTNSNSIVRRFAAIDRTEPFIKDSGYHYGITAWSSTTEPIVKIPERFQYVKFRMANI